MKFIPSFVRMLIIRLSLEKKYLNEWGRSVPPTWQSEWRHSLLCSTFVGWLISKMTQTLKWKQSSRLKIGKNLTARSWPRPKPRFNSYEHLISRWFPSCQKSSSAPASTFPKEIMVGIRSLFFLASQVTPLTMFNNYYYRYSGLLWPIQYRPSVWTL